MLAYLEGKFTFKSPAVVYIDIAGIAYEVNISLNTFAQLEKLEQGRLYTHLQVKEDAHTLFGFFELKEKEMFLLLIGVSGVGASTARMMLSAMHPTEVAAAINSGNARLLESVKGIGKKTAERLVLELKDKTEKGFTGSYTAGRSISSVETDALNALTALGISKQQAEQSIKKVLAANPDTGGLEELIKKALKAI